MMTAREQLAVFGWDGREFSAEVLKLIAEWQPKSKGTHAYHRRRKQLTAGLGLTAWPGIGVLESVATGADYVSPMRAGVILHRVDAVDRPGFAGDADRFHAEQIAVEHDGQSRTRQSPLFSGLDCLAGQQDLFDEGELR
jgi:hypothetical protein